MTYKTPTELRNILQKEGFYAKKGLGQNFLIDDNILQKIITIADLSNKDEVVEVGPGLGVLTQELIKHAKHVTGVEFDGQAVEYLQRAFVGTSNVKIHFQDALLFPLPHTPYKLIANIPYYITSPLLNHFLQPQNSQEQRPQLIVLLVQKEVAQKICAAEDDQSVLSLQVKVFGKPEIIATVSPNCFFPRPKVDSAILKITPYEKPLIENTESFFKIIKITFQQRRKTLSNSLKNLHLGPEKLTKLFEKSNIKPGLRPQQLRIEDWNNLVKNYLELIE
jgi:16S rRNA (adenine1518-N6/adenine1519-N6)-dimethyltransferase